MVTREHLIVPLVTAYTDDASSLSEIRIARLLRMHREAGTTAVVLNTLVGEFGSTTMFERKQVVEWVLRDAGGKLEVFVDISSLSTNNCLELAQHAARYGARSGVIMLPMYGSYDDEEYFWHIRTVATYADLSLILVDPLNKVTSGLRERLAPLSTVKIAEPVPPETGIAVHSPVTNSHEFVCDGLTASPLLAAGEAWSRLCEPGTPRSGEIMRNLFRSSHPAKIAKALLEASGFEIGPCRAPLQPIPHAMLEPLQVLRQAG